MKNRIISILLAVVLAISVGLIGCGGEEVPEYNLTISSTEGGLVTTPGEGIFTYDAGTVVDLVAEAEEGYGFAKWTGNVDRIANVNNASTTITMNGDYTISANFGIGIYDWYDLDAIRDDLDGSYVLMNDLDSTTAGYSALASSTADEGRGWKPIAWAYWANEQGQWIGEMFKGALYGQGYAITDLFINRPHEHKVGLFGILGEGAVIDNVGVVGTDVIGLYHVGGLVGFSKDATVSNSYFIGSVTGISSIGGLMGGTIGGVVSNSYSTGSVTGDQGIGGLVGNAYAVLNNCHYDYDESLINGESMITAGALSSTDFEQWLTNDKFLDINERLSQEDGYYVINDVNDFKQLLAFGQDSSLKFRLETDLDLTDEPNFYIPCLAGEFDGNGHKVSNLRFSFDSVSSVGLFGCLAPSGKIIKMGTENVSVAGHYNVGGLVGLNWDGTVSNSYSTGIVTGWWSLGGLVGGNWGSVTNSYSSCRVAGSEAWIGGLVGRNFGTTSTSYSTGSVIGKAVGGLVGHSGGGTVSNSFWDIETSGQDTSEGGTGKTTAEMKDIANFSGAAWNIIAVAHEETNPAYTWNIVDGETYPFLSWEL